MLQQKSISIFIIFILTSVVSISAREDTNEVGSADPALHKNTTSNSEKDSDSAITDSSSDTTNTSLMTTDSIIDTTALIRGTSDSITDTADSSIRAEEPEIDTSYRVWKHPFWEFGIGWELYLGTEIAYCVKKECVSKLITYKENRY